jgi:ADP-heptose:LPS heptosyltransferase
VSKALVIQLARFGDLVQSKRLIRSLEERGEVHLCADRSLLPLAALLYPRAKLHGLAAHGGGEGEAFDFNRAALARLAAESFDIVYNLNHSGLNRALARLYPDIPARGHYAGNEGQALRSPSLKTLSRLTARRAPASLNLTDFWAFLLPDPIPPRKVNPAARPGGKGIGVVVAGREARRSLPPPMLAACIRAAFESLGGPDIFLFGTKGERAGARSLMRAFPPAMLDKTRNLCGRTEWADLPDALGGLDCLLGPDTGLIHFAAHLGVPVQGFFLSSAWCFETGPYGIGHRVWQACTDCLPCLESAPCALDLRCLPVFGEPGFLGALAGTLGEKGFAGRREFPPLLLHLEAGLDAIGAVWEVRGGNDPRRRQRDALRAVLGEYLGAAPCSGGEARAAAALYEETDWMLTRFSATSLTWEYI